MVQEIAMEKKDIKVQANAKDAAIRRKVSVADGQENLERKFQRKTYNFWKGLDLK